MTWKITFKASFNSCKNTSLATGLFPKNEYLFYLQFHYYYYHYSANAMLFLPIPFISPYHSLNAPGPPQGIQESGELSCGKNFCWQLRLSFLANSPLWMEVVSEIIGIS